MTIQKFFKVLSYYLILINIGMLVYAVIKLDIKFICLFSCFIAVFIFINWLWSEPLKFKL